MSNADINMTRDEISKVRVSGILYETRLLYLKLKIEFEKKQKENLDKRNVE